MKSPSRLELEELEYLTKNYHLSLSPALVSSTPTIDLTDEKKCKKYLERLTILLHSPSMMITASQFIKRYSFLIVAPSLHAMTMFNKGLNLAIHQVSLESSAEHPWLSHISTTELQITAPVAGKREVWRDQIIKGLFAEHLAILLRTISQAANIPMTILWENIAVRVYSLYEKKMGDGASVEVRSRIREDYEYLIHAAPAALFDTKKNPLSQYYGHTCAVTSAKPPIRIRKTCCFYYEVSSIREYCLGCPKINSNEAQVIH
jgi:ferric iron reductase protein FhuF